MYGIRVVQKKSKDTWKHIETRLVSDVEGAYEDNGKLAQALANRNAETEKLAEERDVAVRCHRQAQEELGPLRLELSVATKDLKKVRVNQDAQQREIDRLMDELGKKTEMAQANLKRIVKKFREQTNAAIQVTTATALQGWAEQVAELQVLRPDKANRDLRGPGF
jgi:chromosome segregation ATPase